MTILTPEQNAAIEARADAMGSDAVMVDGTHPFRPDLCFFCMNADVTNPGDELGAIESITHLVHTDDGLRSFTEDLDAEVYHLAVRRGPDAPGQMSAEDIGRRIGAIQ